MKIERVFVGVDDEELQTDSQGVMLIDRPPPGVFSLFAIKQQRRRRGNRVLIQLFNYALINTRNCSPSL
jgi:hypothetical protein